MVFYRKGKVLSLLASPVTAALLFVFLFLDFGELTALIHLAIAVLVMLLSLILFRRYRVISDSVITRLNSAAQGYIEAVGVGRMLDETPGGPGPLHLPAALWMESRQVAYESPFWLDDKAGGTCLINPKKAEVITKRTDYFMDVWFQALYPGETLYVIGEFASYDGDNTLQTKSSDISRLMSDWKRKPDFLLREYDENGDGQIDAEEWQTARKDAEKIVDADHLHEKTKPATHIVKDSTLGYPFIITNLHPDDLERRYQIMMYVYLGLSVLFVFKLLV